MLGTITAMTDEDILGLVVLALLFAPALLLWQWQQLALNDVQDREDQGREQLLGWTYRRWRGRLTWSIVAILRYRRALRAQFQSSSKTQSGRHAGPTAQAAGVRRRTWWWLLSLPPWSLAGLILAKLLGLPVPRLAFIAALIAVGGLVVGPALWLARLRLARRHQRRSQGGSE